MYAQHVPRADAAHDYMYIYSDIIHSTRFGSQKVNILDVIPLPGDVNCKGVNPIMYDPLTLSTIETIANQRDKPTEFEHSDHSVNYVLHIRPR